MLQYYASNSYIKPRASFLRRILKLLALGLFVGCVQQPPQIPQVTETTISVPRAYFKLDDESLNHNEQNIITPGQKRLVYDGPLFVYVEKNVDRFATPLNATGCILTLPLCVLNKMAGERRSDLTSRETHCRAELSFAAEIGRDYEVKIENHQPHLILWSNKRHNLKVEAKLETTTPMNCSASLEQTSTRNPVLNNRDNGP